MNYQDSKIETHFPSDCRHLWFSSIYISGNFSIKLIKLIIHVVHKIVILNVYFLFPVNTLF